MEIKRTGLWIGRQAARMCLMVLLVSIMAFGLLAASPIDPLQTNVGQTALGSMSPEQIARLRSYWGTDLPPVERYLNWLKDFLHGNMGTSLLYRRPVAEVIGEKVLSSVWLLFTAWLLSGILGFFLGVLAGKKRGGVMDRIFAVCGEYAVVLGGHGAAHGICGEASLVPDRIQRSDRNGCRGNLHCGQDPACGSSGCGFKHHGNLIHRPSYEGKTHRGHGK